MGKEDKLKGDNNNNRANAKMAVNK